MNFLAVLIGLTLISFCATQWVDMSYSYDSKTTTFPGTPDLNILPFRTKWRQLGFPTTTF